MATESPISMNTSSLLQFAPLLLIFVVFYFLLIRPQQKAAGDLKKSQETLKNGDKVLTGGGIIGSVKRVVEGSNEIDVEIAPGVKVTVLRSTITQVLPAPLSDQA